MIVLPTQTSFTNPGSRPALVLGLWADGIAPEEISPQDIPLTDAFLETLSEINDNGGKLRVPRTSKSHVGGHALAAALLARLSALEDQQEFEDLNFEDDNTFIDEMERILEEANAC